jgi:hypothetical protein
MAEAFDRAGLRLNSSGATTVYQAPTDPGAGTSLVLSLLAAHRSSNGPEASLEITIADAAGQTLATPVQRQAIGPGMAIELMPNRVVLLPGERLRAKSSPGGAVDLMTSVLAPELLGNRRGIPSMEVYARYLPPDTVGTDQNVVELPAAVAVNVNFEEPAVLTGFAVQVPPTGADVSFPETVVLIQGIPFGAVTVEPAGLSLELQAEVPFIQAGSAPFFVPAAGIELAAAAPTVATGASVSPAALALEISAVAPSTLMPVTATGGDSVTDITAEGINYRVHAFTTIGTSSLVVTAGGSVDYLVVGGGGGGGSRQGGGGGGGGGLLTGTDTLSPDTYTVTVGGGGAGGGASTGGEAGSNGANSILGILTAVGGGGGGPALTTSAATAGSNGGSGGGAGRSTTSTLGGTGTAGQGSNGGANSGTNDGAGGGGGAGAAGQDRVASPLSSGNGGAGVLVAAFAGFGDEGYFAGGGGGGSLTSSGALSGAGGIGGGGDGAGQAGISTAGDGENGMANTGGGGGGGQGEINVNRSGGNGGSGVVLIRYRI